MGTSSPTHPTSATPTGTNTLQNRKHVETRTVETSNALAGLLLVRVGGAPAQMKPVTSPVGLERSQQPDR